MSAFVAPIAAGALIATGVAMCRLAQVVYAAAAGSDEKRLLDVRPPLPFARELVARLLAGLVPLLLPVLLFLAALLLGGEAVQTTRVHVNEGPARNAGMLDGDRLVSVDGQPVSTFDAYRSAMKTRHDRDVASHASSRAVDIGVMRDEQARHLSIAPSADGFIRIAPIMEQHPVGPARAFKLSVTLPFEIWTGLLHGASDPKAETKGPIGLVQETDKEAVHGAAALAFFIASTGAYVAPAFLVVSLLDWLTLALFLRLNPTAAQIDARSALVWRVARCRQLLHVALLVYAVAAVAHECWPASAFIVLPVLIWFTPLLVPLVWVLARAVWSLNTAVLALFSCIVPVLNLIVFWYLSRAARDFMHKGGLRARGFRLGAETSD